MSLKAMALTAGQGTRLRPLTQNIAKPAIPFMGRPLLCHAARHLECLKIDQLVMNVHWCAETVVQAAEYLPVDWKIAISDETSQLLGSGGGLKKAEPLLSDADDILIFNGDEVFLPENPGILSEFLEYHRRSKNLATLLVIEHPGVGKEFGGAWVDSDHKVQKFSKTPLPGLKGYHYVGYMLMSSRAFKYFSDPAKDENILYDCFTRAMAAGETVKVYPCKAQWFETGDLTSFMRATKNISEQIKSGSERPEIAAYQDFLETTVHLGSALYFQAMLVPFKTPGRCQIQAKLFIEDFVGGSFSFKVIEPASLKDIVWFRQKNSLPGRADELWKSTCAELFISEKGSSAYTEFNFSSTLDWASYSFDSERTGMRQSPIQAQVHQKFNNMPPEPLAEIEFQFGLELIPFEIGATAVVEWKDGLIEYYSLQHSKDKPDFHNRADWKWRLG